MLKIDDIEKNSKNLFSFVKETIAHKNSKFYVKEHHTGVEIEFSKAHSTGYDTFPLYFSTKNGVVSCEDENPTVANFQNYLKLYLPQPIKNRNQIVSLLDIVNTKTTNDLGMVLSLPNSSGDVLIANFETLSIESVNKAELVFKENLNTLETIPQEYKLGIGSIRRNIVRESNTIGADAYYTNLFKNEDDSFKHGIVFADFTKLENGDMASFDISKYFDEKNNPFIHKDTYLIYNKKDNEHYFKKFSNDDGAFNFVVNYLDQSKQWNYKKLPELLKEYHTICDVKDYDYEFHYEDDIINNEGAYKEILSLRDEFHDEKNSDANTSSIKVYDTKNKADTEFLIKQFGLDENISLDGMKNETQREWTLKSNKKPFAILKIDHALANLCKIKLGDSFDGKEVTSIELNTLYNEDHLNKIMEDYSKSTEIKDTTPVETTKSSIRRNR